MATAQSDKALRRTEARAHAALDSGHYAAALVHFARLAHWRPQDGYYQYVLGICHLEQHAPATAQLFLDNAVQRGVSLPDLPFYLARAHHLQHRFEEAANYYRRFQQSFDGRSRRHAATRQQLDHYLAQCAFGPQALAQPRPDVQVRNLGPAINSAAAEYVPLIWPDESRLYFTSRRPHTTGNSRDPHLHDYFEDVYVAYRRPNGQWTLPESAGPMINTIRHDACVSLSADGRQMLLYRSEQVGRQADFAEDLYLTRWEGGHWQRPQRLDIVGPGHYEPSAVFSADGRTLVFASDRPGGYGQTDLYAVRQLPNGRWARPYNLGPAINTSFHEDAPFLSTDGQTLYFSSRGHPGMGGYDIFRSRYDTVRRQWLPPQNLGAPVNSAADDIFYVTNPSGERAYFTSFRPGGQGNADLYEATYTLPTWAVLVGQLEDQAGQPLAGTVVAHAGAGDSVAQSETGSDGRFTFVLPAQLPHVFTATTAGYDTARLALTLPAFAEAPASARMVLQPCAPRVPESLTLSFGTEGYALTPAERARLAAWVSALPPDREGYILEIGGHADQTGSPERNWQLALARARAVGQHLQAVGILASSIKVVSHGDQQPIAPNDTPEGRRHNRRVEVRCLPVAP